MPNDETKWLKFDHNEYQLKAPFIVYADTEAILKRLDAAERNRVFRENCSTRAYQEHCVFSVGYYFKCEFDDSKSYYASRNGADCIEWFVEELEMIAQFVAKMLAMNKPMEELTDEEEQAFADPFAKCSICGDELDEIMEIRVRDHCHFTGKFRGAAHADCNLNYQESRIIPIVMHNLSGYDAHMIIKKIASKIRGDVTIIPINTEHYISFTKVVSKSTADLNAREKIKLKFIDSFRFMPASLSHLASLIPTAKKRILYDACKSDYYSTEQMAMLERKGVFPYDYVDCYSRLKETSLPSKDHFYSQLNEEEISTEEYEFACQIWNKFNLKTLGEYSDLYLKTDVLLLADVFENFRNTCHTIYKLDPAHYYTAPGLSFDAMLKYTNVSIELITDVDMLLFVECGIRGGISQCSKRYVKANNKYMNAENYDPEKKSNYLMYLDGMIISIPIFVHKLIKSFIHSYINPILFKWVFFLLIFNS